MKKVILVLLLSMATQLHASWFNNKEDKQRIQRIEQQLGEQQQATGAWQLIAGVVAIGAIGLLVVGAALGSITRRHGKSKR